MVTRTAPVEIVFILAGHRKTVEEIENPVDKIMCRALSQRVARRLAHVRCEEHHEALRVIAAGPSVDELTFTVEGCCQAVIDAATVALP